MKIGIIIIATNAYFILGLRFIRRFQHFYKGNSQVTFYFFSDTDPKDYIDANIIWTKTEHKHWTDGTNSKFNNILTLNNSAEDYLYYFDADTNIINDFTEDWFIGDLVGGEHYDSKRMIRENQIPYDRNPKSKAYIPIDSPLRKMYYYGAFFGGTLFQVINFCDVMKRNQDTDKLINYEPGVNDESYINQYFHFNPPTKVVKCEDFKFVVSDKGGVGETRRTDLNIESYKQILKDNKNKLFNISNGEIIYDI